MRKTLSVLLAIITFFLIVPEVSASGTGSGIFPYTGEYSSGQFDDVNDTDWFSEYVAGAYNFGFFRGVSIDTFNPGGALTLGEAVTVAARLRSIYHTGSADFPVSDPFYRIYADYAFEHGIIDDHPDYTLPVTRAGFVMMVYNSLPETEYPGINDIPEYGVCDVTSDMMYSDSVYAFYRAGILTGVDGYGTFMPNANITRAEACVIMLRIADPASRARISLPSAIPAEIIYNRCTDAVFLIETFYESGRSIRTGSGFFISETGLAAIVLHVFDNAVSAKVTLTNGDVYDVLGLNAFSYEHNVAVFSIDSDRNDFTFLRLADSDLIETGNTVYALGSPRALLNTITEGIISKIPRETDYETMLQFTAPISFGSGGSPVLNTLGQVVGLASSSYTYAQNLNLAVCVNYLKELELTSGELTALKDIYGQTE